MWKKVHAELVRLAGVKGAYDAEEARWLVEAKRLRVREELGFATVHEYLERLFGYGPRLAMERLRVAEALMGLPALRAALASGDLSWSAVRELSRVAIAVTEADWIAAATGKTVRQVEEMVSGRKAGDRPGDPADDGSKRHVLRLEIAADARAAFRDARRQIELDVGHSLDDDALVRQLATMRSEPDVRAQSARVDSRAFRDARRQIELDVGHSLDDDALVRQLAHHALGARRASSVGARRLTRAALVKGVKRGFVSASFFRAARSAPRRVDRSAPRGRRRGDSIHPRRS
jgi:hypothetical protein